MDIHHSFLNQVAKSPSFLHHLARKRSTSQPLEQSLLKELALFLSLALGGDTSEFTAYLKGDIEDSFGRIFNLATPFSIYISSSVEEARVLSLKCALYKRYPFLASEGAVSLTKTPVIYLSEGNNLFSLIKKKSLIILMLLYYQIGALCHPNLDRLAWELLIPRANLRVLPLALSPASAQDSKIPSYTLDLAALEREVKVDLENDLLPCGVLATFGSNLHNACPYQCDDLAGLRQLCDHYGLWLHVEGTSLLLPASSMPPSFAQDVFQHADSVVLQPAPLFQPRSPTLGSLGLALLRPHPSSQSWSPPAHPSSSHGFITWFTLWAELRRTCTVDQKLRTTTTTTVNTGITHTVDKILTCSRYLQELLRKQSYPVLLGPNEPSDAQHQYPHLLFFQILPSPELSLSSLGLDLATFNNWLYTHLAHLLLDGGNNNNNENASPTPSMPNVAAALFEQCVSPTMYQGPDQARLGFLFHPLSSSSDTLRLTAHATPQVLNIYIIIIILIILLTLIALHIIHMIDPSYISHTL